MEYQRSENYYHVDWIPLTDRKCTSPINGSYHSHAINLSQYLNKRKTFLYQLHSFCFFYEGHFPKSALFVTLDITDFRSAPSVRYLGFLLADAGNYRTTRSRRRRGKHLSQPTHHNTVPHSLGANFFLSCCFLPFSARPTR